MPFDHTKKKGREGLGERLDIAQEGLTGPAEEVPHRQTLERAFGQSLGEIKVHRGPDAQVASAALDAEAYAHKGSIVLGPAADLSVVAEEVAHALQQSRNPAGPARVTSVYGPAEREAGDIANSVVSGSMVGPIRQSLCGEAVARRKKKPQKKKKKRPRVVSSPGEKHLRKAMKPKEFGQMRGSLHKQADQLTPKEKTAHIHGQHHLRKRLKEGTKLSRAINPGHVEEYLSGRWKSTRGYVGFDDVTRGMSAGDKIATRGLDYGTPHVTGDKKREPVDEIFNLSFNASKQNVKDLKVPLAPEMIKHRDEHMKGDKEADFPVIPERLTRDPKTRRVDRGNPFKGHGSSQPGPHMDPKFRKYRMNQEMKTEGTELPIGTQMEVTRGEQAEKTIARLLPGRDSKGRFQKRYDRQGKEVNPPEWNLARGLSKEDQKRFGSVIERKRKAKKRVSATTPPKKKKRRKKK